MSLWDELPAGAQNSGNLDGLRSTLESVDGTGPVEETDADGTWSVYTATMNLTGPLALDPRTGGFSTSGGSSGTPIEFRDPNVSAALGLHLTGPGGTRDSGWRIIVGAPSIAIRTPFLRGAFVDSRGQLRADPAQPTVAFVLPATRIRVMQLAGASTAAKLLSATTTGSPTENTYDFVRMEPPHALIGPGDTVGFAYRTAVLDLSGTEGPSGVPATARVLPDAWQGLYLPEIRLFVSPSGVEGLAVSAGVRNLWVGIGEHEGVTGIFEAEVVNRGQTPSLSVRFGTSSGEYIADPGTGTAQLPETSTIFVDTAGGLAPISIAISVNGIGTNDDRAAVTTPATGTITITVSARDSAAHETTRTFTATRRTASVTTGGAGDSLVTVTPARWDSHVIVREAVSASTVTVRLEPRDSVAWSWPGGTSTGETAEVPVGAGGTVVVTATFTAVQRAVADCFFLFDRPHPSDGDPYARNESRTHAEPAADRDHHGSSVTFTRHMSDRLAAIGAGTKLTVDGYASYEGDNSSPEQDDNRELSERRRDMAISILRRIGFTNVVQGAAFGHDPARTQAPLGPTGVTSPPIPAAGASGWWRARVYSEPPAAPEICTAEIRRRATPPPTDTDPKPPAQQRPDCFRKIGVRVEFVRSTFIRGEIYGEFDIETAAESALQRNGQPALRTGARNPSDGICVFLLRLRLSEDRGAWEMTGEFRALDADLDGLAKMDQATANATALNILGALSILAPLTSSATQLSPAAGAVVALGSVALGASDLIHTHTLILRGGELTVSDGIVGPDGTTTVADSGTQVSVLLDLEVVFSFDLGIVRVDQAHPVTTRYKAVGVRSQWGTEGTGGDLEYVPLPVFDPSRGYTLDVPAGALSAAPPLDELLRILGFRVSRDNPTYLEIEVGLGVDLGIVTVDTVRVRARLDSPTLDVQLTKLAASLDIPGTIHGTGSIEFTDQGFKGAFDLTIVPVNIRASAVLAVESNDDGVTGVLIGAEVEFPVPILLGNSGLGIYGFMGGVGVNYARKERTDLQVPALVWLQDQFARPGGVMDPTGWQLTPGSYAFAAGMLVGTVDAGFTVHLKGIVIIEVPGPRLLLVMKADVLSLPPVLDSNQSATFLAVLDIDFGRGTITIGIVAAYEIESVLKIRVPITAFFNSQQPEDWFVELGNYTDRVTVEVLDVLSGSGYLMVHGNGISLPTDPALAVPSGIAVATGFHLQAVLMGSKAVGLYLEVAAGFDAILGLDPFYLGGIIYVRGELRLWIVGISASAELVVQVGKRKVGDVWVTEPYVHGEVCGSVDFFFFEVKGCVELTIGEETTPTPDPLPLVMGVSLIARTPAKLEGTGANSSIDGKLSDAVDITPSAGAPDELPTVPLDAIPAITFRTAPTGAGPIVLGAAAFGTSGAAANPWTRIGDRWWRYELVNVTLDGPLTPATGKTPSTWWAAPADAGPVAGPTLALLDWLPTPHSAAVPYGEALTTQVKHRWGTVCGNAAPPARLLWTFDRCPTGPSPVGWRLDGVAWPDPPDRPRSIPVAGRVDITEPWRIDPVTDRVQATQPATVIGDAVPCYNGRPGTADDPMKYWQTGQPLTFSNRVLPSAAFADVTAQLASGGLFRDLVAIRQENSWDPSTGDPRRRTAFDCEGRILRSPERDEAEPAPFGPDADKERVKQVWNDTAFSPDRLADAVTIDVGTDEFVDVSILLLVPERGLGGNAVVSVRDADGGELGEERIGTGHFINAGNPLPAGWVDPAGPWADPVQRAGRIAARVAATSQQGLYAVLISLRDLPDRASRLVVGWDRDAGQSGDFPAFYVVAAEGMLRSEQRRYDWDSTSRESDRQALSNALTQAPDDHALLVPGELYTVHVTWKAASADGDVQPAASPDPTWGAEETQSYRFQADPASESPKDLSPWILATTPGMDDVGVFLTEKVRIAFATQKVAALFDAYGQQLRLVVRAASGHHPEPPTGGGSAASFVIPVEAAAPFGSIGATFGVQTPWEQAVREMLGETGQRCVPSSGSGSHTYTLTLDYDFEPLTDYLIDIHAVPTASPPTTTGLVHRIGFTTSRFESAAGLAGFISPAPVEHRVVPLTGPIAGLPTTPTGAQVDEAFQAAGLAVPQVPDFPRVQVLWTTDAVPQPFAVVLECSEPLWRSRVVPTVIPAPPDSPDPSHTYWAGRPADWLSVVPGTAPPADSDPPRAGISRIIRGPGGTRAVVLLAAGSRGTEARLDLRTAADQLAGTPESFVTAARISLLRAPWEVED
ncbi:hypothetical protein IWX78_003048 [Mycetocola sp. CAN_C7]|uniref:hypothetical protein n=1 Tax=Mycetocola sp. CAN_C7 TaxID=2787724 RepID=UPI0018CB3F13